MLDGGGWPYFQGILVTFTLVCACKKNMKSKKYETGEGALLVFCIHFGATFFMPDVPFGPKIP